MELAAHDRLEQERELRRALSRSELRVHYQPLVRFASSEVVGFEALVRWEHPRQGLLSPPEFLEGACRSGLVLQLGAFVLREACAEAARWAGECSGRPSLAVSVNLSLAELAAPDLVTVVRNALRDAELDPSLLVLEVQERALTGARDRLVGALHEISSLGVRIAIDDFSGPSALGALKPLPVDTVKIDRALVERLEHDPHGAATVEAAVALGHSLGLTVTAKGVEHAAQLNALRMLGCDVGQGFYFARPQPAEVVRALVHRRFRWSVLETA